MKITDEMILFYNGPFSNWHKHEMKVYGVDYNCVEQWMMSQKARMFQDVRANDAIMASKSSRQQKFFGRLVKGFDPDKWNQSCRSIVEHGVYCKFSQDKKLKKYLLDTGDRVIVEASPFDKIWGIGLGEDNPDALDQSKWKGTNWLGDCLMNVRYRLMGVTDESKTRVD